MKFTYEIKDGMYIYKGPNGHGGIAYTLEEVNRRLVVSYGAGHYELKMA